MSAPDIFVIRPDIQIKRGPLGSRKIRNVCTKCNSGWMSRLESAAKPALTDLILGNKTILDATNQKVISSWTVMTSIISEYTDTPTRSIPASDYQHLMNTNLPPDGWHIWLGTCAGIRWKQGYRHHGLAVGPRQGFRWFVPKYNTQFSTFGIGSLLIHAASSTVPNLVQKFDKSTLGGLIQIWPQMSPNVTLPSALVLTDEQANQIADAFCSQLLSSVYADKVDP